MIRTAKMLVLFMLVLIAVPSLGHAMDRNFGQIYTECGIGAMLFQHKKWAGLAALSNVIWDWGTTASSSALTSPETCIGGKEEKMAAFIYHSVDSLENDLAKGYGEHLDTLMVLAGKNQTDVKFVESMRHDLASLVADPSYSTKSQYQKAEALYNIVTKNNVTVS